MRDAVVLGVLGALSAGCGSYRSDYVPPQDGRARVLWKDDSVVASLPALIPGCAAVLFGDKPESPGPSSSGSSGAVFSRQTVIVVPRVRPPFPYLSRATPQGAPIHRVAAKPGPARSSGGAGRSGGVTQGGGGGGMGSGSGELMVVLAVITLTTLPVVTIGLALGRPEPEEEVARGIDAVNDYNEAVRTTGWPCGIAVAAGVEP